MKKIAVSSSFENRAKILFFLLFPSFLDVKVWRNVFVFFGKNSISVAPGSASKQVNQVKQVSNCVHSVTEWKCKLHRTDCCRVQFASQHVFFSFYCCFSLAARIFPKPPILMFCHYAWEDIIPGSCLEVR